jgi:hypothetical protein
MQNSIMTIDPETRTARAKAAALAGRPKLRIDGVVYDSLTDAAIHYNTTVYKLKKNFLIEEIKEIK